MQDQGELSEKPGIRTRVAPGKILIVDDDVRLILALKRRLKAAGYTVIYALDAAAALRIATPERPHLIILDLGMACRDGFWLLEQLRVLPSTAMIPVIVLTGGDADETQKRAFQAGATDFFQKPVEEKDLLASIEVALAPAASNTRST